MPTFFDATGIFLLSSTVLLCLGRMIQRWSWGKAVLTIVSIFLAVLFGEQIVEYAPQAFSFLAEYLWDFSLKFIVIVTVFVFFAQIVAMIKKVIFSNPCKRFFGRIHAHYVASAQNESHRLARFIVYSVSVIKIAMIEFYAIDEEDGEDEIVEKVATMEKWGLVDSIYDWSWSVVAMALVEFWVKVNFSLLALFFVGWIFDNVKAVGAVKMAEAFDKDLSFGKAFRRVFDRVRLHSPWIANLWMIWINTVGIIWDGPDQVMYFYHKELNTVARRWMFLLPTTAVQAAFWIWAYSEGLEEAGDFIKYITGLL